MGQWAFLIAAGCFLLPFCAYSWATRPVIRRLERLRALGRLPDGAPENFNATSADLWAMSRRPELVGDEVLMRHVERLRAVGGFATIGAIVGVAIIVATTAGLL